MFNQKYVKKVYSEQFQLILGYMSVRYPFENSVQ